MIHNNHILAQKINDGIVRSIPIISKFDSIVFDNDRPLVICDIDETLLYLCEFGPYNNSKYPLFYNKNRSLLSGSNYTMDPLSRTILPTDIEGFRRLEDRVRNLGGKLIFLTARSSNGYSYVVKDFEKIGLDASKYEIHFTGNTVHKGVYIQKRINLSGYNDIYFIDDMTENVLSVITCIPRAYVYLFSRGSSSS
jgi:hypothetical protein